MKLAGLWNLTSQMVDSCRRRRSDYRDLPSFRQEVRYSVWHVAKIFLFCLAHDLSPNLFYEKLTRQKGFRRQCKIPNRLISFSQFKKRLARHHRVSFIRALLAILAQSARTVLQNLDTEEVRIVTMDLTRIESNPRRDPWGAWGFDSKGLFYGYKLGFIMSQNGVVLGLTLTRANWGEFNVNRRLIRMARDVIETTWGEIPVEFLLCDSGFDGEKTYRAAFQDLGGAHTLCPPRRRRNPKAKYARQKESRARNHQPFRYASHELWKFEETLLIYRKRLEIERVNGQLKDQPIRIHEIPRRSRGVRRLLPICLGKLILYNSALNVNARERRPLRSIKALMA